QDERGGHFADASELGGLSDGELRARYDAAGSREDFSEMIAKEMRERERKRQRIAKGKEKVCGRGRSQLSASMSSFGHVPEETK
ncbi:hypothetical protein FRB99_005288, partial [Tulasnella sp. 403]